MQEIKNLQSIGKAIQLKQKQGNGFRKMYRKELTLDKIKYSTKKTPEKHTVRVKNVRIGEGNCVIIAGPCSLESEEQIFEIAKCVKKSGGDILRAGCFKMRTSPYSFQGLGIEGIKILKEVGKEIGIPVSTEIVRTEHLDLFDDIDLIQVGARNMQNYELLKELSRIDKPILLKRGAGSTLEELLFAAEYLMMNGKEDIILCERGIKTFETGTRNTLDISAVPLLHESSCLPVAVDPSHASGIKSLVRDLSLASVACGSDALLIETHNCPEKALSDSEQQISLNEFRKLAGEIKKLSKFIKEM